MNPTFMYATFKQCVHLRYLLYLVDETMSLLLYGKLWVRLYRSAYSYCKEPGGTVKSSDRVFLKTKALALNGNTCASKSCETFYFRKVLAELG